MKHTTLLSFILLFSISAFAQDANKAFAITGNGTGDFNWMNIRQIDLSTGLVTKNIYINGVTKFTLIRNDPQSNYTYGDAVPQITAEELNRVPSIDINNALNGNISPSPSLAIGSLVAAAAYDRKHNKLFFTPMSISELRWLDLSSGSETPKFYTLQSPLLSQGNSKDEANQFSRMAIGADGNGYALTNDANHLIKFTTGKKVVITDLGSLVDASSNNHISVHNKCSSWGGDIVADAFGGLYLFTASKQIFKINIETRIATHIGGITGLSGAYTVNGAAVDVDDNVIISSANTFEGFYKVNMKDITAAKLNTTGQIFNASDLANGNLLFESQARNSVGAAPLVQREVIGNQFISIYPNPVFGSQFKITFENKTTGDYTITLTDVQGKVIMTRQVFVKSVDQVEIIQLKSKPANGMYMIKVTNENKRSVFSDKIVIE
ncbi:MAG TPA: T9SS type A sorting domain-containing protein [Chitinophagaceae bacterium]